MMADNVPAVQALGQCIFLPMLIIGGVAVPLASLPDWAQRLSGFFPGRYAVEALQACVTGDGLGAARFSALALVAHRRRRLRRRREDVPVGRSSSGSRPPPGKAWVAVALAAWVGVGVMAETQGRKQGERWLAPWPARCQPPESGGSAVSSADGVRDSAGTR